MKVNEIEKKILYLLQKNARLKIKEIAREVGLSIPAVTERIRKLENAGIIKRYSTIIDPKKVGLDITAFVGIYIDHPSNIENFEKEIEKIGNEICECHHVTGDFTLLIKIRTKNTDTLATLIKKLRSIKGVVRTHTFVVFSTIQENVNLPLDLI